MGNRLPKHTSGQVKTHNTLDDCWIVAHGNVYDITEFIKNNNHPAGNTMFARFAGGLQDADKDYNFHTHCGKKMWEKYKIGKLVT